MKETNIAPVLGPGERKRGVAEGDARVAELTFSTIIGALSYALDLTEGAHPGHAIRTCLLGMRIGEELRLSQGELSDLYYALLLKDAGCSSNASRLHQIVGGDEIYAKAFSKLNDWTRFEWRQIRFLFEFVHSEEPLLDRVRAIGNVVRHSSENAAELFTLRCFQGATVVKSLGLSEGVAQAIFNLDEHWDGKGYPSRLRGDKIPRLAQIVNLAQTLDVFHQQYGELAALDCMRRRTGKWFDPDVVRGALALVRRGALWNGLDHPDLRHQVAALEPSTLTLRADAEGIDRICVAFSEVVDAKSPSTYTHSVNVAKISVDLGKCLGLGEEDLVTLRRAGLLHDVGKLSVPNSILDKPGKLTAEQWQCVKQHPFYTHQILERIPTFALITDIASAHHEKLDGSGYHRGWEAKKLCRSMRILAVADMYEALTAKRSYRTALGHEEVMAILCRDVPHALDAECVAALEVRFRGEAEVVEPEFYAGDHGYLPPHAELDVITGL